MSSGEVSFVREVECGGKTLQVKQFYVGDVGCVVWDAALVLCRFLENKLHFPDGFWCGKSVLDLGAGTGVTGLAAGTLGIGVQLYPNECPLSTDWPQYIPCEGGDTGPGAVDIKALGKKLVNFFSGNGRPVTVVFNCLRVAVILAHVVVTDLPEFVELMTDNIDLNKSCITGWVSARTLIWGQDVSNIQSPDVILMADVVYYEKVLEDLVKTLVDLSNENTLTVMSYEERMTGNKPEIEKRFFQLMNKQFTYRAVPLEEQDAEIRSPDIHIIVFTKLTI